MKARRIAFASSLVLGLLVGAASSSASVGPSCTRQIQICEAKIGGMYQALSRLSAACEASGGDGCHQAVAAAEVRIEAARLECVERINDACG